MYDDFIRLLDVVAVRLTAITQRGSLPFNQAVIFVTLVVLPLAALMLGARDRIDLQLWDTRCSSPWPCWWWRAGSVRPWLATGCLRC